MEDRKFEEWFADFDKQPWPEEPKEFARRVWQARESLVKNLSMLVFRLSRRLALRDDGKAMAAQAVDFLARHGLQGSPLRQTLPQADHTRIPEGEDEAAMMVLLGTDWLERNVPHRLRQPGEEAIKAAYLEGCRAGRWPYRSSEERCLDLWERSDAKAAMKTIKEEA